MSYQQKIIFESNRITTDIQFEHGKKAFSSDEPSSNSNAKRMGIQFF